MPFCAHLKENSKWESYILSSLSNTYSYLMGAWPKNDFPKILFFGNSWLTSSKIICFSSPDLWLLLLLERLVLLLFELEGLDTTSDEAEEREESVFKVAPNRSEMLWEDCKWLLLSLEMSLLLSLLLFNEPAWECTVGSEVFLESVFSSTWGWCEVGVPLWPWVLSMKLENNN